MKIFEVVEYGVKKQIAQIVFTRQMGMAVAEGSTNLLN